jgi:hypothetical protein
LTNCFGSSREGRHYYDILLIVELEGKESDGSYTYKFNRWGGTREMRKVSLPPNLGSRDKKCVKINSRINLVLNKEISMHQVIGMVRKALMKHFHGRSILESNIKEWIRHV